jgi:hypothetical protein
LWITVCTELWLFPSLSAEISSNVTCVSSWISSSTFSAFLLVDAVHGCQDAAHPLCLLFHFWITPPTHTKSGISILFFFCALQ